MKQKGSCYDRKKTERRNFQTVGFFSGRRGTGRKNGRFYRTERRQDRMQRASRQTVEPEPVQNETNDTIVLRPEPKKTESAGTTVMFDPEKIEEEDTDTNKTVVINDNEIQSLLDEDKPPKLRREVVSHGGSSHRKDLGHIKNQPEKRTFTGSDCRDSDCSTGCSRSDWIWRLYVDEFWKRR